MPNKTIYSCVLHSWGAIKKSWPLIKMPQGYSSKMPQQIKGLTGKLEDPSLVPYTVER